MSFLSKLMTPIELYCSVRKAKQHLYVSRGVTILYGAKGRSKFGVLMFEPEVFRKQMYSTEESICEIVRRFQRPPQSSGAPIVIWRPGNCAPSLRPCTLANNLAVSHKNELSVPIFFSNRPNFSNDRKILCQFGHNHRKGRLVNTATSFNIITGQIIDIT